MTTPAAHLPDPPAAPPAPRPGRRGLRWFALLTLLVAIATLGTLAYRNRNLRQFRSELAGARQAMTAGRFATARARLQALRHRWPGRPEILLDLGACEEALNRPDQASEAWAGVPSTSLLYPEAAARRGTLLLNRGRYRPAEEAMLPALKCPGPGAYRLRRALARLYRFEGRTDEVRHLVESCWDLAPDRVELLKERWVMDGSPVPIEGVRKALEHADPDDDRVWLGRANLAMETGAFDEAARWLQRCDERARKGPSVEAVTRTRLRLALARDDDETAWRTMEYVNEGDLDGTARQALRTRLAERLASPEVQRREYQRLLALDPGNTRALDRLAELAAATGDAREVAELRRRKAEIDDARDAYRKRIDLHAPDELAYQSGILARLAGRMHRTFEARGWAEVAAGRRIGPDRAGRLSHDPRPSPGASSLPLSNALADLRPPSSSQIPGTTFRPTPPAFTDDAEAVGLRHTFDAGHSSRAQLPEIMSGGVALLDYDNDGWLDVYALQGGPCAPDVPRERDRLFRNNGDGTFADATESAGIDRLPRGYGMGAAVGDIDNDGDPDLFLTRLGSYALLRNNGDGTFADITDTAGLAAGPRDWPSSAAFADLDNDGDLDLYVAHYAKWDPHNPTLCLNQQKQAYYYCNPSEVAAEHDRLFRNRGDGTFEDMTEAAGITDPDGRGLGVVAADFDDDGRIDLYVANDGTANYLFRNLGDFRFEEIGQLAGVAGNAEGGFQAGMGVACGDLDGDGLPDLIVTNFYGEAATYYHNLGAGHFADHTAASGLGAATRFLLGFGAAVLDYDRDGRADLLIANGHVNDSRPYFPFAMPTLLLAGDGAGKLTDASTQAGPPWSPPHLGRGLAIGDLDNDGRIDALLIPQDEPLIYLHNRTEGGHTLTLHLEGTTSNRDAIGAVVTITAGGRRQVIPRFGGGSYLSASDPRLHVGLGPADRADSVEVRWPSGSKQPFENLQAGRIHHLREGWPPE